MNKNTAIYALVGLVMGVAITLVVVRNDKVVAPTGMIGQENTNRTMMGIGIDRHFIEQMIPHHDGAIEMAKLAKEKSQRKEILDLADNIIKSQKAENEQMRAWYREWYGKDVVVDENSQMGKGRGVMHGGMMGDTDDLEELRSAEDFDTAFLREMIPHHQMAVMMAQMLLSSTERPEMKQLAENIIKAQEAEIEQMRDWLTE